MLSAAAVTSPCQVGWSPVKRTITAQVGLWAWSSHWLLGRRLFWHHVRSRMTFISQTHFCAAWGVVYWFQDKAGWQFVFNYLRCQSFESTFWLWRSCWANRMLNIHCQALSIPSLRHTSLVMAITPQRRVNIALYLTFNEIAHKHRGCREQPLSVMSVTCK